MKLRHAAALALVGWYLMTPPVTTITRSDRYYRVVAKAPLPLWESVGPFETGDDCNSYRVTLNEDLKEHQAVSEAPNPSTGQVYQGSYAQARQASALYAQCVASDDPRLKSK